MQCAAVDASGAPRRDRQELHQRGADLAAREGPVEPRRFRLQPLAHCRRRRATRASPASSSRKATATFQQTTKHFTCLGLLLCNATCRKPLGFGRSPAKTSFLCGEMRSEGAYCSCHGTESLQSAIVRRFMSMPAAKKPITCDCYADDCDRC